MNVCAHVRKTQASFSLDHFWASLMSPKGTRKDGKQPAKRAAEKASVPAKASGSAKKDAQSKVALHKVPDCCHICQVSPKARMATYHCPRAPVIVDAWMWGGVSILCTLFVCAGKWLPG